MSPEFGGSVVAFAVESASGWRHVLFTGSRAEMQGRPTRYGVPVLFPFPGVVREARYRWDGRQYRLPVNAPGGGGHVHGFAHDRAWKLIGFGDSWVELEFETPGFLRRDERPGYPFIVQVRQQICLGLEGLSVTAVATNRGEHPAPVGLGLHPYFSLPFLGERRSDVTVVLPDCAERVLEGSIPAGPIRAVGRGSIAPLGDGMSLRSWTGFTTPLDVTVEGDVGGVALTLDGDVSDLTLFAPDDQPSMSIEPTVGPISAGSLLDDGGDAAEGLTLAPGGQRRIRLVVKAM